MTKARRIRLARRMLMRLVRYFMVKKYG